MAEHRKWTELPRDVISLIFLKLGAIEVLLGAQAVCRSWWQVAHEPQVWRCIVMHLMDARGEKLAREAGDCCGSVSDELLSYIADRSAGPRLIGISSFPPLNETYVPSRYPFSRCVTVEGLSAFVGRCPLLEELQINISPTLSEQTFEGVIRMICGKLIRLRLNKWPNLTFDHSPYDIEALEIANYMPQLRELQLKGNNITNKGLHAILDKCLYLESLDIRGCYGVHVVGGLKAKLTKLKNVRLPCGTIYHYETVMDDNDYLSDVDYLSYMDDYLSLDYADNSD